MDLLPNEIRLLILSYLPTEALITTVKSVSKQFLLFTQQQLTEYKTATQYRDIFGDAQLATLARDYPNITALDLSNCTSISDNGLKIILMKFPNLKSVALPYFRWQTRQIMWQPLCPSVTRFDARNMNPVVESWHGNLSDGSDYETSAFPNLEELLFAPKGSYRLRVMKLENIKTATIMAPYDGAKISSDSLTELNLTCAEGIDIKDCKNLRALQGSWFEATVLDQLPNLERLTLQPHSQRDLDPLIDAICSNKLKQLWYLEFIYCQALTPEHLQRLVTSCQSVKKIVIRIPAYPTTTYLRVESKAIDLRQSQSRINVVVVGGENRHKTLALSHWPPIVEHIIPNETSEQLTACSYCNRSVKKSDLQDHYTICVQWPGWACMLSQHGCHVKDMTHTQRQQHLNSCEFNEYHCIPCNVSDKMIRYEQHCQHYHRLDKYVQSIAMWHCANKDMGCVAEFTSQADLTCHMRDCTADKDEYTCKSCDGDFESRPALLAHMAEKCSGDRKKRLLGEEALVQLTEVAARMVREGFEMWGTSNRHRFWSF